MNLKLTKGLKLNIAGDLKQADQKPVALDVSKFAITPDDYEGFVPKLAIREGDMVAEGTPLLFDKNHPDMKLVSPVTGKVTAVVRGERRKILRVEIEKGVSDVAAPQLPAATDEASARQLLAQSGLLALMRRRPYAIVPDPSDEVRDIFVSALDEAPLAVSPVVFEHIFTKADYEAGVALLSKITKGKIYFSHGAEWFQGDIAGAEMVEVTGSFPSSNPGVQAANIKPVNKGEVIWTLDLPTLGRIGRLAATGKPEWRTLVAVCGPEVSKPGLVEVPVGAAVAPLLAGRLADGGHHRRVVSGNVLVGSAVDPDEGYIRYPYVQLTVIAEGDDRNEFMGWASLSPKKMSESPSFPGHFLSKLFRPDARLNGSRRAMIMSGQYDKMLPMDILTEYLVKAILAGNIDDMEKLGIYEVAPEDFAAAEYADTSKLPLQQIVRDGLDYLRKELE